MNKKTTDELLNILKHTKQQSGLNKYLHKYVSEESTADFLSYLHRLLDQSSLDKSELIRRAEIQRNYGYQILNGQKRPGRDKIIALSLAMGADLDSVQRLLTLAKEGILYSKVHRDAILIFAVNKKISVMETNELLVEMGDAPL